MLADFGVQIPCFENICYKIFLFNFNILIILIVTRMGRFSFFFPNPEAQKKLLKSCEFFLIRKELLGDK